MKQGREPRPQGTRRREPLQHRRAVRAPLHVSPVSAHASEDRGQFPVLAARLGAASSRPEICVREPGTGLQPPGLWGRGRGSTRAATARGAAGAGRGRAGAGRRQTAETRRRAGRRRAFSARRGAELTGGRGAAGGAERAGADPELSRDRAAERGPGEEQPWRRAGPGPAPLLAAWVPSSRAGARAAAAAAAEAAAPVPPALQAPRPAPGPPAMVTHAAAARRRQDHG